MSTPVNAPFPASGTRPQGDREPCDQPDPGRRVRDLSAYRLARLEAEVLAPARETTLAHSRLKRLISAYVGLAISDPGIAPLLTHMLSGPRTATASPETPNGVDSFLKTLRDDLVEVIGTRDRTPPIDPEVAVQSLLGIIHWGINCHRTEDRLSRDEAVAQITTLALHGLLPHRTTRVGYQPE